MKQFKLHIRIAALLLLLSIIAAACAPAATPTPTVAPTETSAPQPTEPPTAVPTEEATETPAAMQPLSVKDASGAELKLDKPAERIVCITTACIDLLASLGLLPVGALSDYIKLASDPRYFGEKGKEISPISGGFFEPNVEEIAALKPDLVIGYSGDQDALRDALKTIAPLYLFAAKPSYKTVFSHLRQIGILTGRAAQAETAIQTLEDKIAGYKQKISTKAKALIFVSSGLTDVEVSTNQTPSGSLLAEITDYPWPLPDGVENYGGDLPFSLEKILEVNPDFIFVETVTYSSDAVEPMSKQLVKPMGKEISAARKGRGGRGVNPLVWNAGAGPISLGIVLDEAVAILYPDLASKP